MHAELTHVAVDPSGFPLDGKPEVAVLGRSNVGKSAFINALLGRKRLARTSARPGKTRLVQFYRVADAAYLVDLPGYGYAAVSRGERDTWRPLVESYLRGEREALSGAILLLDVRRGPEEEEDLLLGWLSSEQIPVRLVVTKADKLSRAKAEASTRAFAQALALPAENVALVSALSGKGLRPVGAWIRAWTDLELVRPDGTPLLP